MLSLIFAPLFWWCAFRYVTPIWYGKNYTVSDAFPIFPVPDWLKVNFRCRKTCESCRDNIHITMWKMDTIWDYPPVFLWRHGMPLRFIYEVYFFDPLKKYTS